MTHPWKFAYPRAHLASASQKVQCAHCSRGLPQVRAQLIPA
jgi:hypothetical protein